MAHSCNRFEFVPRVPHFVSVHARFGVKTLGQLFDCVQLLLVNEVILHRFPVRSRIAMIVMKRPMAPMTSAIRSSSRRSRFIEIATEFWFGPQACGVSASVETCRIGTFHRFALTRAVTVNDLETTPVRHFFWHVVILLRDDLASFPVSVPGLAGLTRTAHDALTTHSARRPSLISVSIASP